MTDRRRRALLLDAVVGWRDLVEAKHAQRARLAKAVMRLAACRLRWALHVWQAHTEEALDAAEETADAEVAAHVALEAGCRKLQVGVCMRRAGLTAGCIPCVAISWVGLTVGCMPCVAISWVGMAMDVCGLIDVSTGFLSRAHPPPQRLRLRQVLTGASTRLLALHMSHDCLRCACRTTKPPTAWQRHSEQQQRRQAGMQALLQQRIATMVERCFDEWRACVAARRAQTAVRCWTPPARMLCVKQHHALSNKHIAASLNACCIPLFTLIHVMYKPTTWPAPHPHPSMRRLPNPMHWPEQSAGSTRQLLQPWRRGGRGWPGACSWRWQPPGCKHAVHGVWCCRRGRWGLLCVGLDTLLQLLSWLVDGVVHDE